MAHTVRAFELEGSKDLKKGQDRVTQIAILYREGCYKMSSPVRMKFMAIISGNVRNEIC